MKYVSLPEVKNLLKKVRAVGELNTNQRCAWEQAKRCAKLGVKKTKKLAKELSEVEKVKAPLAYKIADLLPQSAEEVRALFAKSRYTLGKKEVDRILEIVKKYRR